MPPANSPSDTRAVSPEALFATLPRISIPVPSNDDIRNRWPQPFDAHDDNVAFLRSRRRSSPDASGPSRQRRRRQQNQIEEPAEDPMVLDHPINERVDVEVNRRIPIIRPQRDEPSGQPNYEDRVSSVPSLYGWAPGSNNVNQQTVEVSAQEHDDSGDQSDSSTAGSSSSLTWLSRPGAASQDATRDAIRRHLRREGRAESASVNESTSVNDYLRYSQNAISTEALLQSVRRQSRFSRARTLHHYLVDRERASQAAEEDRYRSSAAPTSTSRAYRYVPNNRGQSPGRSQSSVPRTQRFLQRRSAEEASRSVAPRRGQTANSNGPPLENIISYLDRLRCSSSHEETIFSAAENGFLSLGYYSWDEDDFMLDAAGLAPPAECSWLRPGMVFSGSQRAAHCSTSMLSHRIPSSLGASTGQPVIVNGSDTTRISVYTSSGRRYMAHNLYNVGSGKDENWPVKVTIHGINHKDMTLTGTMEAYNIPDKSSPNREAHIITYLEGEIVDFNTHTLVTKNFQADPEIDSTYWRELQPFKDMTDDEIGKSLLSKKWLTEDLLGNWILMRWKERCFITPTDSRQGLTISGFYYISLRRDNGQIAGLYYDPGSSPYQQLSLGPETDKMVCPSYGFR